MSQTREARKAAERRRLARRKAEARGEAVPAWVIDGGLPPTPNLYRLGLTAVAALALARSERSRPASESVADVPDGLPTPTAPERPDTRTDWTREPITDENRARDAVTRTTGAAESRATFADVLATACGAHSRPGGVPCWAVPTDDARADRRALCGARIRAAGYLPSATPTPSRAPRGRWAA